MKTRLSPQIDQTDDNPALVSAYVALHHVSSKGFLQKELIIQTHSPAFTTVGMSHRIYGPLQLHSCKTNNRSTWLNWPSLKSRISPQIPIPAKQTNHRETFMQICRKKENYWQEKFPSYVVISKETDICSLFSGSKSWHISNRSGRLAYL